MQNLKGKTQQSTDSATFIKPLLNLEKESENGISPWKVVVDMPAKDGKYFDAPVIQFCSGAPAYDRLVLTFQEDNLDVRLDSSCIEKNPDLSVLHSRHSPDQKNITLQAIKEFYDDSKVQRVAILGSARVFPYQKAINPKDTSEGMTPLTENNKWGQRYTSHVQNQVNKFFNYMEDNDVLFTTTNGGWAGTQEESMGVPMMSNLMGVMHEYDTGCSFPPITVMAKIGAFDRVRTRAEAYHGGKIGSDLPTINTYFEINGAWGDDSKYLAGLSTSLLVFQPFGYWTNIEIANGIAQGKPVVIIADPDKLAKDGEYYDLFKNKEAYIEKEINMPDSTKGSYRIYKDAGDAAQWINQCYLESQIDKSMIESKRKEPILYSMNQSIPQADHCQLESRPNKRKHFENN